MKGEDIRLILEKAVQRGARIFGYDLKPVASQKSRPLDILGLAIGDLMASQEEIFFVQIGAHDGRTYDPISAYVRKHGWRGLLVEPQPDIFATLQKNYAGSTGLIFENVAIAEEEGSLTLYRFKNATADDHSSMLASTKRHYLQLNGDQEKGEIEEIKVPATTLNGLLDRHAISRVDLLQIDTEGYDYFILRGLDFRRMKPKIIHFENNFLNRRQRDEVLRRLTEEGYAISDLGVDTVAYLQAADADFAVRASVSKIS